MGKPMPFERLKTNGTQLKQHGKLWEPATHRPKYETHIIGPG